MRITFTSSIFVAWAVVAVAVTADAESRLLLQYPPNFGTFPATTYNADGERLGSAVFEISTRPDGNVHILLESEIEGSAGNVVEATLGAVVRKDGTRALRILHERSQSWDEAGKRLVLVEIDHVEGTASCIPADQSLAHEAEVLRLPKKDRVANVPMNLLFLPLVQGKVREISYQSFLCRGGPRFMDFKAYAERSQPKGSPHPIVVVKFGPELGPMFSWIGNLVAPTLAFWFDANASGTYLAHRMPLFSKGPDVMIVRDGISPAVLPAIP